MEGMASVGCAVVVMVRCVGVTLSGGREVSLRVGVTLRDGIGVSFNMGVTPMEGIGVSLRVGIGVSLRVGTGVILSVGAGAILSVGAGATLREGLGDTVSTEGIQFMRSSSELEMPPNIGSNAWALYFRPKPFTPKCEKRGCLSRKAELSISLIA